MPPTRKSEPVADRAGEAPGRRYLGIFLAAYAAYLILLGPYLSLCASGTLDNLPRRVTDALFLPAWPIYQTPLVRSFYDDYLTLWHHDGLDRPTGWH